jgi:hypothetical protein
VYATDKFFCSNGLSKYYVIKKACFETDIYGQKAASYSMRYIEHTQFMISRMNKFLIVDRSRVSKYDSFSLVSHEKMCEISYKNSLFLHGNDSCYTVKTGVSFRHSLRHRNSASASVVSTLKSVCLGGKQYL